jgi:predicted aldo/keto reductase-like oxidoreductase
MGLEYMKDQPRETVIAAIRAAITAGVNYFDIIFSMTDYLDNLNAAFAGSRDRIFITGHLGSTEEDGQYAKSRHVKKSETAFLNLLDRLNTDHVDIIFLHNCDVPRDYAQLTKANGLLDLALRFRDEGKARFIGFSGHTVDTALQAVETGHIDVLMFPVNIPGNSVEGKRHLLNVCASRNVAVVAMKPFAGGKLFQPKRTLDIASYQSGGTSFKVKKNTPVTPVQCISYVLAQPGVVTTVPGCKNADEVAQALAYLTSTTEERDYSTILTEFDQYVSGECTYCNHCLPCPAKINIGETMRFLDLVKQEMTSRLFASYEAMNAHAGDCKGCNACAKRCPFSVDIVNRMKEALTVFGK